MRLLLMQLTTTAIIGLITTTQTFAGDVGRRITGAAGERAVYFNNSDGSARAGEWSSAEIAAMKLTIQAEKGDFVQVISGGKAVWLDIDKIRVERSVPECAPIKVGTGNEKNQVAGTRGGSKAGACQ